MSITPDEIGVTRQPLPQFPEKGIEYAGFWVRVKATLIDLVLFVPGLFILGYLLFGAAYFRISTTGWTAAEAFTNLAQLTYTLGFWFARQATPGKMLAGLRIVDARTLEKPRPWQWIVRYLAYIPATLIFFLGIFWVAIDRRRQGWHDKLARTLVIYDRSA